MGRESGHWPGDRSAFGRNYCLCLERNPLVECLAADGQPGAFRPAANKPEFRRTDDFSRGLSGFSAGFQ